MLRMRTWVALAAVAMLAFAGIAVADQPSTAVTTTAAFPATTKSKAETHTCGAVELTRATFTGTATSGDAALSGPLEIRVESWFNTDTKLGLIKGNWSVDSAGPGESKGKLSAVNSNGTISGWLEGHAAGGKKVAGTFTGSWSKDSGFSSLSIGSGSATDVLLLSSGRCKGGKD